MNRVTKTAVLSREINYARRSTKVEFLEADISNFSKLGDMYPLNYRKQLLKNLDKVALLELISHLDALTI